MSVLRHALRLAAAAVITTGITAAISVNSADAQRRLGEFRQEQWQELDNRRVAPGTGSVNMPVGRHEGRHTAIRLQVLDEPMFIRSLQVTYENNTRNDIPIRRLLRPGETTEPLDLEGGARLIRDVQVTFQGYFLGHVKFPAEKDTQNLREAVGFVR